MEATYMLCRNRVADYDAWKLHFDSFRQAQRAAGLELLHLCREMEDPSNVFFLFEIRSVEEARAFLNAAENREAGKRAGVLESELHYLAGDEALERHEVGQPR